MDKQEWWATLNPLEKSLVRELPAFCGEAFETFGPFEIARKEYDGVGGYTTPLHKPFTAYRPWRLDDDT